MALPMNEPSAPFDEFEHAEPSVQEVQRGFFARGIRAGLQGISFGALWIALLTALGIVLVHTFRFAGGTLPDFPWTLKSAIPLMAIGISYLSLIFTVPRTAPQRFLGLLVGAAFVLWGAEQFMTNRELISLIDDLVAFLFVVDLSIVIRGNLAKPSGKDGVPKGDLPTSQRPPEKPAA
jgi:hypothetical protein